MKDEILTLTKKLIVIQSVKENTDALKKVLIVPDKYLKGFNKNNFIKNKSFSSLYSNTGKIPKRFKVILNAHLDVVPGKESQYKPVVKGDSLIGRGAMDMKSAAAVEILVFREVADKVNYPLGLQLVTDEEIGGFNGTKHQIEKGIRSDFVIAGEPTHFGVNNKAKGIVWAKLKVKGVSAHGAYPWKGINANLNLINALNKISKYYPTPKKEVWKTTVNVGRLLTENETYNKVPDAAEAWLDIRYLPEESENIIKNIEKILPVNAELEVQLIEPSQLTDENNEYLQKLRRSTKKITGRMSPVIVKHGGSDIRHFNKVNCAGVTFGPYGEGMHSDNEWVSIKSLTDYYNILKDFLLSV